MKCALNFKQENEIINIIYIIIDESHRMRLSHMEIAFHNGQYDDTRRGDEIIERTHYISKTEIRRFEQSQNSRMKILVSVTFPYIFIHYFVQS